MRISGEEDKDKNPTSPPSPWKPSEYPYPTDYNDHFETPLVAYQDIQPILEAYLSTLQPSDQIIYDPYYCDGRTSRLLHSLGFPNVLHNCCDFYSHPASQYGILVTNPPFSGDHKQRCLDFCIASQRPWLVLLPAYCITKQYVKTTTADGVRYRIPSTTYQYVHPEGTGHAECPFRESVWLCGGFPSSFRSRLDEWTTASLEQVAQRLHVPTGNRPNPKQRRKKSRTSASTATDGALSSTKVDTSTKIKENTSKSPAATTKRTKKKSKYRDGNGKRTKGRF